MAIFESREEGLQHRDEDLPWDRVEDLINTLDEAIEWGGDNSPSQAWGWFEYPPTRDFHFHDYSYAEVREMLDELKALTIEQGWWPVQDPGHDWLWVRTPLSEWVQTRMNMEQQAAAVDGPSDGPSDGLGRF